MSLRIARMMKRYASLTALLPALLLPLLIVTGCGNDDQCKERDANGWCTNPRPTPAPSSAIDTATKSLDDNVYNKGNDPNGKHKQAPRIASLRRNTPPGDGITPGGGPPFAGGGQQDSGALQAAIIQASASVSDEEIQARYNLILLTLNTRKNGALAYLLYTTTNTPLELEVTLYRITPDMRAALWSRLTPDRINGTLYYLQPDEQVAMAKYLALLSQLGLAPSTSVPWNRIP